MADWYQYVAPKRSRADRVRVARKSKRVVLRHRQPPKVRGLKHIFYSEYSSDLFINGYKAKVMTRYSIAKFFAVPESTVHSWAALGVLPEPLIVQNRGQHVVPLYLSAQIRCLLIIIRDLVKDGYVSIQWRGLEEHFEMLHRGYAETLANFQKRMSSEPYNGEGRRGVIFHD